MSVIHIDDKKDFASMSQEELRKEMDYYYYRISYLKSFYEPNSTPFKKIIKRYEGIIKLLHTYSLLRG